MWVVLLRISRVRPIHIIFTYSHVGVHMNELADEYAELASKRPPLRFGGLDTNPRGAATAPVPPPLWWRDEARRQANVLRQREDDRYAKVTSGTASLRTQFGPLAPKFVGLHHATQGQISDLARLRTGVHPKLGPVQHGYGEDCRVCGEKGALHRLPGKGEASVVHLFKCPAMSNERLQKRVKGPEALWESPADALRYFYAYLDIKARETARRGQS